MEISEVSNSNQLDSKTIKTIESRFNQTNGSRIAELITGLRPEDPKMPEKLTEIQGRILEKYQLPDIALSFSLGIEFDRIIRHKVAENGVSFLLKDETQPFFDKYPQLFAAYFHEKKAIGINVEKQKDPNYNYFIYNLTLMHEVIHALQDHNGDFDRLSVEWLEFEATIGSNLLSIYQNPNIRSHITEEQITTEMSIMFENFYLSIQAYEQQGGITHKNKYTPENILKEIDGITDDQIRSFEQNHNPISKVSTNS